MSVEMLRIVILQGDSRLWSRLLADRASQSELFTAEEEGSRHPGVLLHPGEDLGLSPGHQATSLQDPLPGGGGGQLHDDLRLYD